MISQKEKYVSPFFKKFGKMFRSINNLMNFFYFILYESH